MKPEINSVVENEQLKTRTLAVSIAITASATPASKTVETNLPGVAYLRTEGKTATADAVEDLSSDFATAADATGVFGLLLDGSKLNADDVSEVLAVRADVSNGVGTLAVSSPSGGSEVTAYLTTDGNIAVDLDSNQNLTTTDINAVIFVTYKI
jgi:hypothetical protein